jgi:hypothetical protein
MQMSVVTVPRRQSVARGDARKPGDATPHCGRRLSLAFGKFVDRTRPTVMETIQHIYVSHLPNPTPLP